MAMGQVLKFSGGDMSMYDAIRNELGIVDNVGWPEALIAHSAGATPDGFVVAEWWESEDAWNEFFATKLQPAFAKVGNIPQPEVTQFDVHNAHIRDA
jgi:heme-degrading monooxygenase HmoA